MSTESEIRAAARSVFVSRLLRGGNSISEIVQELAEQAIRGADDRIDREVAQRLENLACDIRDLGK